MQFPGCRDLNALHATTPYGLCSIHRMQSCNCLQPIKVENMSPVAGMSPSYPHSEPSPDQYSSPNGGGGGGAPSASAAPGGRLPRPPSCSPPLTPHSPAHNNHRAIKSVGRCEVVQSFIYLGSLIDNSG
ncbi:unnamed protein product [Callosobruchus maculatus]|uniref:Uncharacterized protein n=1 Tax=Callosobruchus maculatus TaxID=64391 RepID=A0A653CJV7_CALMS|nr:unnamed protein product [Callosobruchus maculatus]